MPSVEDAENPDDETPAERTGAAEPDVADAIAEVAPTFDAVPDLPAGDDVETSEAEASESDGWGNWGEDAAFAEAFEMESGSDAGAEDEESTAATEGVVGPEPAPFQVPASNDGATEPEADDEWDFAAALGRTEDESGEPSPLNEPEPEPEALPVAVLEFEVATLDASDVVTDLATPAEPIDVEDSVPDSDEFDFDAALRAAEDQVEGAKEVEATAVDREPDAWSLSGSAEPDFEAALSGETETWPIAASASMAADEEAVGDEDAAPNESPAIAESTAFEAAWTAAAAGETTTDEDTAAGTSESPWGSEPEPAATSWTQAQDEPDMRWTPEPEPDAEPAAAVEGDNPWATLVDDDEDVANVHEPAVPSTEADEDADAWAAIADASGYNADEELVPPTFGKIARSPRDDERSSWLADNFPEQEPIPDPVDEAFAQHDEEDMERDLVLRAFEAHAATDVDEEDEPLEPGAFQELFGSEAQGIVDDLIEPQEVQSFAKMRMAPQRTSTPGSAPFDDEDDWIEGAEEDDDFDLPVEGDLEEAAFLAGSLRAQDPAEAKKTRTWVRELVETGLLALLVFLSVRASFQNFKVDGSSMYPTLTDGQFLIVNKLVYSEVNLDKLGKYVPLVDGGDDPTKHVFHGPERGDIIVLRDPSTPEQDLIKRVIGLPGEKIEVYDGAVYINDQKLIEPYLKDAWGRSGQGNYPAVIIPADSYFVMGDNRDNSKDSRSSQIGFIAEDLIIGRAEFTYLPLSAFGLIGNGGSSLSEQDGRPHLTSDLRPTENLAALATR